MTTPTRKRSTRVSIEAWVIGFVAVSMGATFAASCIGDAPVCVPGDRLGCRCHDNTYGYATCSSAGQYGPDAACDCTRGLSPDAATP